MSSVKDQRLLTQFDFARLSRLDADNLPDELLQCLDDAEIVAPQEIPPDVITMNSQFVMADDVSRERLQFTLCFPKDADASKGFISVLSPAGASFLGLRHGAKARWRGPHGREQSATVNRVVFQPEAAGDFTL